MSNKINLLLVEDDPDDVELMRQALEDNGLEFSMEVVNHGDKVIPHLETCKKFPDVIVLDLNLPKLHGREVLKRIKAMDTFSTIPVAILTTSSSQTERDHCLNAGADAFITKPSSVPGFNDMVATIMGVAVRVTQQSR
jgi:CheY-like chemotaxis protein